VARALPALSNALRMNAKPPRNAYSAHSKCFRSTAVRRAPDEFDYRERAALAIGGASLRGRSAAHRAIVDHLDTTLRTRDLAALVRLSPSFLPRFPDSLGDSPHSYVMRENGARAGLMLSTAASLAQIARIAGCRPGSFQQGVPQFAGESPGAWRRAARRAH